jgi:hypothetical protein
MASWRTTSSMIAALIAAASPVLADPPPAAPSGDDSLRYAEAPAPATSPRTFSSLLGVPIGAGVGVGVGVGVGGGVRVPLPPVPPVPPPPVVYGPPVDVRWGAPRVRRTYTTYYERRYSGLGFLIGGGSALINGTTSLTIGILRLEETAGDPLGIVMIATGGVAMTAGIPLAIVGIVFLATRGLHPDEASMPIQLAATPSGWALQF